MSRLSKEQESELREYSNASGDHATLVWDILFDEIDALREELKEVKQARGEE